MNTDASAEIVGGSQMMLLLSYGLHVGQHLFKQFGRVVTKPCVRHIAYSELLVVVLTVVLFGRHFLLAVIQNRDVAGHPFRGWPLTHFVADVKIS